MRMKLRSVFTFHAYIECMVWNLTPRISLLFPDVSHSVNRDVDKSLYLSILVQMPHRGHNQSPLSPRTPRWSPDPSAPLRFRAATGRLGAPVHTGCCSGPADPPSPQRPLPLRCLNRYRQEEAGWGAGSLSGRCIRTWCMVCVHSGSTPERQ